MKRRNLLTASLALGLAACGQASQLQQQQQLREFDQIVAGLRDNYIDRAKVGTEWQRQVDALRAKFTAKTTAEGYARLVAELLATLKDPDPFVASNATEEIAVAASAEPTSAGIGILADLPSASKQRILVLTVFEGSAAQAAGIKPHDAILAVDGRAVRDDPTILARVRGPVNTQVRLSVQTPGQAARDLTLTRKPIPRSSPTVARLLPGTNYAYLLPSATLEPERMRDDWVVALRRLSADRPLDGVILDLRTTRMLDFPLREALSLFVNGHVASRFIRGSAGTFNRATDEANKLTVQGRNVVDSQRVPLMVLVGDLTEGNAEAFAGILQSLGRATVIGNKTPGRTVEYVDVDLPVSEARLRVPNADYRSLKGEQWHKLGVTPNPASSQLWEQFTEDSDPHMKMALDALARR
jgi:carboxyl-terminal processing protease